MRAGHQDAGIFGGYKDGTGLDSFVALSLGWDHVAEHEWGIKDLLDDFKCNTKKQGLAAYKINKLAEISDILLEDDYSAMKSRLRTLAQRLQHNLPEPPTPERPQILSDDFEPLHFGVSKSKS